MSTAIEEMGMDSIVVEKVETQEVKGAFEPLASGVYKGKVIELATFVTTKGATQLKVVFQPNGDHDEVTIYQNVKKKNGEANEIGQATFRHVIDACGLSMADVTIKTQTIKGYAKDVEGKVVQGIKTKPITGFVRSVFEEGADFENYNEIEAWGRADGTNSKGEDLVAAYKEKIEKTPVLIRKKKAGGNASTKAETKSADGASVDDML